MTPRSTFSKRRLSNKLTQLVRMMVPTLFALSLASVAHAQGMMDFSGAQTLMGTFKTFAIYAGDAWASKLKSMET